MLGQAAGLIFRQAITREGLGGGRSQGAKTLRRTVDHSDRHLGSDLPPILPAVKLRKIVRAHDPDKAQAGNAAAQIFNGVGSVSRSDDGFETTDIDARIVGHPARGLRAFVEIVQGRVILQRIAGGDQPPHAVELQSLDCEQADGAMRDMRRIEGAAEQPDPHAVAVERDL